MTKEPPSKDAKAGDEDGRSDERGICCPRCDCPRHVVVYTRRVGDRRICRMRECEHCGRRFSTIERVAGGQG